MRNSRGVADAEEARGGVHERVRFAEPVSAPRAASRDGDDAEHVVEITLEVDRVGGKLVAVHRVKELPAGGAGDDSDVTPGQPSSYAHGVRRARARIQQVSQELRALASSRRRGGGPGSADGLTFVSPADASAGWAAVERRFDEEATDGLLHRSKFAKCIGMKELAFAGELFDALARRRCISGDSISKPEMLEFWDQISDHSFDSRLHTFIDMIDKGTDGRISKEDAKEMIELSANANNLTIVAQHSEEYGQLMMEELDTYNGGYTEIFDMEKLLRQKASHPTPVGTSTNNGNLSQRLRPTAKPNALRQWCHSLNQQLRMFPYACERMARPLRSSARPVDVLGAAVYLDPASAVSLRLSKPQGFRYKSGQYVFLNCPAVSRSQWRPFYITSAPQDDHVGVHIRTLGDWTQELNNVFSKVRRSPTEEGKSFPKVLMDGPYGAPTQDYKQYEVVLLVGLGIGAAPMISIIRDIISNMKRPDGDDDESSCNRRTQRAYFYWVNQEQASFEWFRGVMDEVVETGDEGVIELHNYCTSVHEEGDARSTLISVLQSLNHAKHGVDVVSGARVKTHFGRPNWRSVYERIAFKHCEQRIGVFYCGTPMLTKELSELAQNFSTRTRTKFEFHNANF